jgi:hypothetical protein
MVRPDGAIAAGLNVGPVASPPGSKSSAPLDAIVSSHSGPRGQARWRFISDEPGVQNTCDYGAQIVGEIVSAPRPLIAFLDKEPMIVEPNRTKNYEELRSLNGISAQFLTKRK